MMDLGGADCYDSACTCGTFPRNERRKTRINGNKVDSSRQVEGVLEEAVGQMQYEFILTALIRHCNKLQGISLRLFTGCKNAAGKLRQKW